MIAQITAVNNDPGSQPFLNVYMVSFSAGSSSIAQLIHGPIVIPGGTNGGIGGYGTGVSAHLAINPLCCRPIFVINLINIFDYIMLNLGTLTVHM